MWMPEGFFDEVRKKKVRKSYSRARHKPSLGHSPNLHPSQLKLSVHGQLLCDGTCADSSAVLPSFCTGTSSCWSPDSLPNLSGSSSMRSDFIAQFLANQTIENGITHVCISTQPQMVFMFLLPLNQMRCVQSSGRCILTFILFTSCPSKSLIGPISSIFFGTSVFSLIRTETASVHHALQSTITA